MRIPASCNTSRTGPLHFASPITNEDATDLGISHRQRAADLAHECFVGMRRRPLWSAKYSVRPRSSGSELIRLKGTVDVRSPSAYDLLVMAKAAQTTAPEGGHPSLEHVCAEPRAVDIRL
jgi:hypothetical protein